MPQTVRFALEQTHQHCAAGQRARPVPRHTQTREPQAGTLEPNKTQSTMGKTENTGKNMSKSDYWQIAAAVLTAVGNALSEAFSDRR